MARYDSICHVFVWYRWSYSVLFLCDRSNGGKEEERGGGDSMDQ